MRASAGVLPLAIAALVITGLVPGGSASAVTPTPLPLPLPHTMTITAAPPHAAPGSEVHLFVQGATPSALTKVQVCRASQPFSLADGPARLDADGSDESTGAGASPFLPARIPADVQPNSGEIMYNYSFWLSEACPKPESLRLDPYQRSNRVIVRVDPFPAVPTTAVPVVVPETQVLGERFTRPAAVPTTAPVQPAKAAVAVARAAGFTG